MRLLAALTVLTCAGLAPAQFYGYPNMPMPGQARVATDAAGVGVRVDQRLNEFVPLDTKFTDDNGSLVELRKFFGEKPVVMLPIFYKCAGICESELMSLITTVKGFKKDNVGREFNIVVIGIDPTEDWKLAAAKKDTAIAAYMTTNTDRKKRLTAEKGWHFLTGDEASIRKTTDALGFQFTYDKQSGNIVHPAGLMVLTPAGKISRYFVSTEYPQQIMVDAIRDAGKNLIGVKDDRPFFLACIQIDPLTGQRSLNILNTLKTLGVVTLIAVMGAIVVWNRKYRATHGGTA